MDEQAKDLINQYFWS